MSIGSRIGKLEREDGDRCEVCGRTAQHPDIVDGLCDPGDPMPEPCAVCGRAPNIVEIDEEIVGVFDGQTESDFGGIH